MKNNVELLHCVFLRIIARRVSPAFSRTQTHPVTKWSEVPLKSHTRSYWALSDGSVHLIRPSWPLTPPPPHPSSFYFSLPSSASPKYTQHHDPTVQKMLISGKKTTPRTKSKLSPETDYLIFRHILGKVKTTKCNNLSKNVNEKILKVLLIITVKWI